MPGHSDAHRVVVVGAGFGGLAATRRLARAPVRVTVVDRQNHHLFQPLLYQVATSGLAAPDVAAAVRDVLRKQANARVLLADVTGVDLVAREVVLDRGRLPYDTLVLAAGAVNHWFGQAAWEAVAPGLKTLQDAFRIRARVLGAFEAAERTDDPAETVGWLTFVVIGAGPTGVELAGALKEIATHTMARNFRTFNPADARVVLVEGGERVLPALSEVSSAAALRQLGDMGVEVRLRARVVHIDAFRVRLATPEGEVELGTRTVLWAAGVRGSPLGAGLGAPLDRGGRVVVGPDLCLPGHPEVFVIGDMAALEQDGAPVPGVAPAAIQMGGHAARTVVDRLRGRTTPPFRYVDKGSMATIGRSKAVAEVFGLKLSGYLAWLLWVVVHVLTLVGFRNRVAVMLEWAWAWFTWRRSARVVAEPVREGLPEVVP